MAKSLRYTVLLAVACIGCSAAQVRYTPPLQLDLCNIKQKEWVLGLGADLDALVHLAQDLLPFLPASQAAPEPNPCLK